VDWSAYCRSGKKPDDIPARPDHVYPQQWRDTADWLGNGRGNWRPFKKARALARSLGFTSRNQWNAYCRSGKKPNDTPNHPATVYADDGWAGWPDWLGGGRRIRNWRPFEEARDFVRSLALKSEGEWRAYCRSGKKPNDIPRAANEIYADAGWISWSDWVGNDVVRGNWRPFKKARALARSLGFTSRNQWNAYCHSGKKPDDIPVKPNMVYADAGWVGIGDWLGKATAAA
jgi:3-mercaptopyruvate sulfurtransferase SseA